MKRKTSKKTELKVLIWMDLSKLDELERESITDMDRMVYGTLLLRPEHREFEKGAPKGDHATQEEFARYLKQDPSQISRLLSRRVLTPALPWRLWVLQWAAYHQGVAAGRRGSGY